MADGPRFEPITRRTVAGEIRERLTECILANEFAPGSQLPSERALCTEFAVARTSVREAIQGLVSVGLVERRGNRTHIVERLPEVEVDHRKVRVRELFEVRRVIEPTIAELAANRSTADDRELVAGIAQRFFEELELPEFRRLDRAFHAAVAQACGNPTLSEVYAKVLDALFSASEFESLLYAQQNQAAVDRIVADAGKGHKRIADALVACDPVAARATTEEHLTAIEDLMVSQLR